MHLNQVDFQQLKERVSIEQVLSHYGLRLNPAGPGNLRGPCPLPTHTSRASTDSFSVQLVRNVWSCHSASCMAARQVRSEGMRGQRQQTRSFFCEGLGNGAAIVAGP